ncbi:hypothetical protein B0H13DRAFT_2337108 [Mycena leptocephala]|nr:hypothetical protein B0H13DRAFT_2337108 [Mycena leptocephala]
MPALVLDPYAASYPALSPSSVCPERSHHYSCRLFLLPDKTQSQRMRAGTDSVQGGGGDNGAACLGREGFIMDKGARGGDEQEAQNDTQYSRLAYLAQGPD